MKVLKKISLSLFLSCIFTTAFPQGVVTLSKEQLKDKIMGGWAGQMIGVSYGAPLEFRSNGKIIETNLNNYQDWDAERIKNSLEQDDIYVDITFATVLDSLGLDATFDDFANYFRDSKYLLFHANAQARQNLRQGIPASLAGTPKYNIHANDIDFQIEADFIGSMTPGLPQYSNKYCEKIGRIMNYGDGLYGGMFVAGMYSAAFIENDVPTVLKKGLACIPAESKYAKIIRDVIDSHEQYPSDWKKTWQFIGDKWDHQDVCPGGVAKPYNIDASINGAYIAIGLLYGEKDLEKTMQIAARCGQDADCNASSSAGIISTMLGYSRIPDKYKAGLDEIADSKFDNTTYSFNDIVASTLDRAYKLIEAAGGSISDDEVTIAVQNPVSPPLEQFDMGKPVKMIAVTDPAWKWNGNWQNKKGVIEWYNNYDGKLGKGNKTAESELTFSGTGLLILGINNKNGGMADVFVDGKKAGTINSYVAEDTFNDALWHVSNLTNALHTVKIVMRNDADNSSKGKELHILGASVYK